MCVGELVPTVQVGEQWVFPHIPSADNPPRTHIPLQRMLCPMLHCGEVLGGRLRPSAACILLCWVLRCC